MVTPYFIKISGRFFAENTKKINEGFYWQAIFRDIRPLFYNNINTSSNNW